jgi:uridine phosphorylase
MMDPNDAIINPVWGKGKPKLGPIAVMVATRDDLFRMRRILYLGGVRGSDLFMSRLYIGNRGRAAVSLTGPLIGAPYAAMVLEALIAGGARKIIFFGWCGAVSPRVKIGDVVVPSAAMIDEGTSIHYCPDEGVIATPSVYLRQQIRSMFKKKELNFHDGIVWTTDAVYRETPEKIERFQRRDVLAVEMETSALLSIGRFRKIDIGAVLVVSDELSTFSWKPGFSNEHFRKRLDEVAEVISLLSHHLYQSTD